MVNGAVLMMKIPSSVNFLLGEGRGFPGVTGRWRRWNDGDGFRNEEENDIDD